MAGDLRHTWYDQAVYAAQLLLCADFHGLHMGQTPEAGYVLTEGSLQRQHANPDLTRLLILPICSK